MNRVRVIISILKSWLLAIWVLLSFLGNLDWLVSKLRSNYYKQHPPYDWLESIVEFLSLWWGYLILGSTIIFVFEWFYRRTRSYLGENVVAKLSFSVLPVNDNYASLVITNKENLDIKDCYATLISVKYAKYKEEFKPYMDEVNPYRKPLRWETETERIVIGRNGGQARLNILKKENKSLTFLFGGYDKNITDQGMFWIKLGFDGMIESKPIKRKEFEGFVKLQYLTDLLSADELEEVLALSIEKKKEQTDVGELPEGRKAFSFGEGKPPKDWEPGLY